jgi:hypothetical protein
MLKKFIQTALLLVVLFTTATTYAQVSQAPDGIQFQALATDANGHPAAGRVIYVKDAIVAKTATGTIVYSETFKVTASSAGIFTIVLGKGTYASGVRSIANIDWANGPFFLNLKIAVEPSVPNASWNVNNEYVDLGTSQFWSTPYALYAGNVKGMDTKLNIADTAAMLKPYFTSINLKANIESPTFTGTVSGITKAMVGLGNVDNTADIDKPVSSATQAALDLKANATDVTTSLATKVDKVTGKALSTNDYTTAEKTKLAAITGTNTGDQDLSALATNTALALKANTADVSTSLATKVDKVTGKELSTNDYTTAEKTKLAAITGTNTGDQINITGNAATATKLATPRNINGIAFDGSENITVAAAASTLSGIVQVVNGGTGSSTKNFVDLNSEQTIAGVKTFNKDIVVNSVMIGKGGSTQADNIAIGNGARSGNINTGGNANIAIGSDAQKNNTGFYNVSLGNANLVNGSGDENTALGYTVMANNTTGMRNTGVGLFSFYQNTTGNYNTAIGHGSLGLNTTGSYNTALGTNADVVSNNLTNATAIGYGASVDASNSIQLGNTSVTNVKTSGTITAGNITYPNTAGTNGYVLTTNGSGIASWSAANVGVSSVGSILASSVVNGADIISGVLNLAPADATNGGIVTAGAQTIGGAKTFNTDLNVNGLTVGRGAGGISVNTVSGLGALQSNTTGSYNTAYGFNTLRSNTTGGSNTASGTNALFTNTTGSNNTGIGVDALNSNSTGSFNTAIGQATLYKNTFGNNNTANGYYALGNNTTGVSNTANGDGALYSNTTGGSNTSVGRSALYTNTTGSNNTALGRNADVATNNLTNATAIGYGASVAANNSIQLGNTSVTNVKTSGTITAGSVTYPNSHGTANQVLSTSGSGTLTWASTGVKNTYYGIYNALNASNSGGIFYTEHGGHPFFPDDLPDGFQCTIIMFSNHPWESNALSSGSTTRFHSKLAGSNDGTGRRTFKMSGRGGVVFVNVVTINNAKCYFVSGDLAPN